MTSPNESETGERYLRIARQWFTEGWAGNLALAGGKLAITLVWHGTHTGSYGGVAGTGKRVQVRDSAIRHFKDGKVTEILTLQDQFGLLKQIGYLPDSVYAA